jgi:hypothetical protein
MDKTEMWLKNNDPNYCSCDRKYMEYPYLTERQMQHRIGSPNIVGKEIASSNIYPLEENLRFSDRHGKADESVRQLLSLMD